MCRYVDIHLATLARAAVEAAVRRQGVDIVHQAGGGGGGVGQGAGRLHLRLQLRHRHRVRALPPTPHPRRVVSCDSSFVSSCVPSCVPSCVRVRHLDVPRLQQLRRVAPRRGSCGVVHVLRGQTQLLQLRAGQLVPRPRVLGRLDVHLQILQIVWISQQVSSSATSICICMLPGLAPPASDSAGAVALKAEIGNRRLNIASGVECETEIDAPLSSMDGSSQQGEIFC